MGEGPEMERKLAARQAAQKARGGEQFCGFAEGYESEDQDPAFVSSGRSGLGVEKLAAPRSLLFGLARTWRRGFFRKVPTCTSTSRARFGR